MSTMSRIDCDAHTPKPVFRRYANYESTAASQDAGIRTDVR